MATILYDQPATQAATVGIASRHAAKPKSFYELCVSADIGPDSVPPDGFPIKVDDECMTAMSRKVNGAGELVYQVERGLNLTAVAAHSAGATVTAGWGGGGGGVTVTGSQGGTASGSAVQSPGLVTQVDASTVGVDPFGPLTWDPVFGNIEQPIGLQNAPAKLVLQPDDGVGSGGNAQLIGGTGTTGTDGGDAWLCAGGGNNDGVGAQVLAKAGRFNGTAGDLRLLSGGPGTGSGAHGGDILLSLANGDGAGRMGLLIFAQIPTSDPAVAGAVWNDTGTLKVSAG